MKKIILFTLVIWGFYYTAADAQRSGKGSIRGNTLNVIRSFSDSLNSVPEVDSMPVKELQNNLDLILAFAKKENDTAKLERIRFYIMYVAKATTQVNSKKRLQSIHIINDDIRYKIMKGDTTFNLEEVSDFDPAKPNKYKIITVRAFIAGKQITTGTYRLCWGTAFCPAQKADVISGKIQIGTGVSDGYPPFKVRVPCGAKVFWLKDETNKHLYRCINDPIPITPVTDETIDVSFEE